jgi:uncharacterized protein involved in response to NO
MTEVSKTPRQRWLDCAFLSVGLRPMFLAAALWAVLAMCLWVAMLSGFLDLPTRFDPISWHSHEFLFGRYTRMFRHHYLYFLTPLFCLIFCLIF